MSAESGTIRATRQFVCADQAGKTDLISGQRNVTWFQVDRPGVCRGQRPEYCGLQQARTGAIVVAGAPGHA